MHVRNVLPHASAMPALRGAAVMGNHLLDSLDTETLARITPRLSRVKLGFKDTIYRKDGPIDCVYFVEDGLISMVSIMEDGTQAEVGMIGREGMAGTSLLAGVSTSFVECTVQVPGMALRMGAREFRQEIEGDAGLRGLLMRYNEALLGQVMQTAACNGRHRLEQRLARWLLMSHDRANGPSIPVTQDLLATMLAVHRPSVSLVAGELQRANLIRYAAGHVTVIDRAGLEAACCECYAVVQRRFDTLLGTAASDGER